MWVSIGMLMQNFRKIFQAVLELEPNNGKIWPPPPHILTKIHEKNSPNQIFFFFNNVPGVLSLILNANILDFESVKLKLQPF